jgi:hypothetical protein
MAHKRHAGAAPGRRHGGPNCRSLAACSAVLRRSKAVGLRAGRVAGRVACVSRRRLVDDVGSFSEAKLHFIEYKTLAEIYLIFFQFVEHLLTIFETTLCPSRIQ